MVYIRLLDAYRNIPLAVSKDASLNSQGQVDPIEVFSFIETELTESLNFLPMKMGRMEMEKNKDNGIKLVLLHYWFVFI